MTPRWHCITFSYFSFFSVLPVQICKYACFHKLNSEPFGRHSISFQMSLHACPQPQQHLCTHLFCLLFYVTSVIWICISCSFGIHVGVKLLQMNTMKNPDLYLDHNELIINKQNAEKHHVKKVKGSIREASQKELWKIRWMIDF